MMVVMKINYMLLQYSIIMNTSRGFNMDNYFSAPTLVDISLTNRCNMCCSYCYASSGTVDDAITELTCEDYEKIFAELDNLRVHRISLSGGEPFIRKDFFDILKLAEKHHFAIVINSNGTLITEEIAKELKKYRFDRICITLDGSQPTIHESMRGSGSFQNVIKGIKELQRCNLPVSTLFTLNKNNVKDLINTIKFNELLGISYMTVMIVCPTGRASDGAMLVRPEEWYPVFYEITKMKAENKIKLNLRIVPPNEGEIFWHYYFPLEYYGRVDLLKVWNQDIKEKENSKREISCTAGKRAASIMYNGDVYGCDLMCGIEDFRAGNIKENSFIEIWNESPVFKKLRNLSFKDVVGPCGQCEYKWCGGGCRSAAYNLSGSYYGSDLSCFKGKRDTNVE